jgi:hypothetical protein
MLPCLMMTQQLKKAEAVCCNNIGPLSFPCQTIDGFVLFKVLSGIPTQALTTLIKVE